MAVAWVLRHPEVTSALIGASKLSQIDDALGAIEQRAFAPEELQAIEAVLAE
jgi:L-glyceraldehyde 3-phosphate reductase